MKFPLGIAIGLAIIAVSFAALFQYGLNSVNAQTPGYGTHDGYSIEIREIRLTDNTRCILMFAGQRGGISCDWGKHD